MDVSFNQKFKTAATVLQDLLTQQHALLVAEKEQMAQEKIVHEKSIATEREELEREKEEFEEMKKKLEEMYYPVEEVIDLNVGGTKFTTLRSTLVKYPGSMLEAMFSGRHRITKDKKDRFFIDRSPEVFKLVMEFLRTDKFPPLQSSFEQLAFFRELDYFGLPKHIQLSFSHIMDINGVFYHLGTKGGIEAWQNPAVTGLIKVTASTKAGADLSLLASRALDHSIENSYDSDRDPWLAVLLKNHKLIPSYYMIHQDKEGDHLLRNWTLEASNSSTNNWIVIKNHINDTAISPQTLCGAWSIECTEAYDHFRIHVGASHKGTKNYSISMMEFYGALLPLNLPACT